MEADGVPVVGVVGAWRDNHNWNRCSNWSRRGTELESRLLVVVGADSFRTCN